MRQLCQLLGWEEDLEALMAAGRAQFEQSQAGGSEGVEDAVPGGDGSTEVVLRATAEAAAAAEAAVPAAKAAAAALAAEPAGEAAAEATAEAVAGKVAAQAAL